MKKFFAFFILFLIAGIGLYAEPTNSPKPRENVVLGRALALANSNRHRIPARHNEVECFYQDGYLHLAFEYSEGNAILSITDLMDTPHIAQQFSTAMPFSIFIGEPNEPLKIEIKTESHIYTGWINQY